MSNESSITQKANAVLKATESSLLKNAEACFKYLIENNNEQHFKTPQMAITSVLENKFKLSYQVNPQELIDKAGDALHSTYSKTKLSTYKERVSNWLNGQKGIERKSALQLCFALELSVDEAEEFLRRVGEHPLNVRDSQEAIWLYCLTNNRSYAIAEDIYDKYKNSDVKSSAEVNGQSSTGETTKKFLSEITAEGNWDNDESFLNTFLIPNKVKFTTVSNTAYGQYYYEKRLLQIKCINQRLKEESAYVLSELIYTGDDIKLYNYLSGNTDKGEVPFIDKLTLLNDYYYGYEDFANEYKKDPINCWHLLSDKLTFDIENGIFSNRKEAVDDFLNSILGYDGLLKEVLGDIPYSKGKFLYSESRLKGFFSCFPCQEYFSDIESSKIGSSTFIVRKMVVYMFFMNYILDWKFQEGGSNKGYEDFYDRLTNILNKCQMSALYPANQFDFLILITIRNLELSTNENEWDDAMDYFYDTVALSFDQIKD